MQRKSDFIFAFCLSCAVFVDIEGTFVLQYKNKCGFILFFAHLFVPLHPIFEINALITG